MRKRNTCVSDDCAFFKEPDKVYTSSKMSKSKKSAVKEDLNECESNLKRKFEEVAQKSDASSDDEDEDLFLPQGLISSSWLAYEVMAISFSEQLVKC